MKHPTSHMIILAAVLVIVAGLAAACRPTATAEGNPSPTAAVNSHALPEYIRPAPAQYVRPVMDGIGWFLKRDSIRENSGVKYVEFLAVSTGEFYTLTLPVEGQPVLDVVGAYMPLKTGMVEMPMALGVTLPDGEYLYFNAARNASEPIMRSQALAESAALFPRGQVISLVISGYVSLEGVDWEKCAAEALPAYAKACRLALDFSRLAEPSAERMFISKISSTTRWMPVGWRFLDYKTTVPLEVTR